ncbi:hypothetical protein OTB20_05930 [Streptomyces sp. H27-H1]|uniref:SCO2400 family protein n=1 Tax=Streptomyces sp. H27-H1 TaxID=2996461 RepID=UPI002271654C|nr:hypothetical protein [Streptomyces sp. H27-H1]MCY0925749.1 hypothetical protein [Streptomyces sp. H27-H1]
MDYCIACRRYLNGALACAGCGTPAEYLISAAPAAPAAAAFGSDPTVLADVYADSLVVLSGDRGQGRAAGRRRAVHRRRRRTALTAGLGLLLAAGASLGLARLATDGERADRAATVELTDDAGPREPDPLPGLTGAPAAPSGKASAKGPAARSAKASAGGTKQGGAGSAAGGAGASAAGPSAPSSGAAGPSRSAAGVGGGVLPLPVPPVAPTSRGAATPGGTPTSKGPKPNPTPKPAPTPSPEPTPECSLWDWLCW